ATTSAERAYSAVLASAGAVLPRRDAVDRRIVDDVRQGRGRIIDSPRDVGGWPELAATAAPPDRDGDGMPDAWEDSRGLDAEDPGDGPRTSANGYTELEHYLHTLAARASAPAD